jgi:hypothetical protein
MPPRADVDVLQPDPRAALEAGEGGEEDRVADRLTLDFDDQRLRGPLLEERRAQDLGVATDLVGELLVLGQLGDQAEEQVDVGLGRRTDEQVHRPGA